MKLINNILKLEGYGVYLTMHGKKLYESKIDPKTGGPTMDPDKCIEWTECTDPPNQQFLNIVNQVFGVALTLCDFGKIMSVSEVKSVFNPPRISGLLPPPTGLEGVDVNKLMFVDTKKGKK